MFTNASVSAAPSHTCSILTLNEEKRIESLEFEVETARKVKEGTEDPVMLGIANTVLSGFRQELQETQKKIQMKKKSLCQACSVS
jgi:hypothetical protein